MCFVSCLRLTSCGRFKDLTMQTSLKDAIRTSLGRLSGIYETLDKLDCLYGTLKLYFNNVIVINFVECVKLTFSRHP